MLFQYLGKLGKQSVMPSFVINHLSKWTEDRDKGDTFRPKLKQCPQLLTYSDQSLKSIDTHLKFITPERGRPETFEITYIERTAFLSYLFQQFESLGGFWFPFSKTQIVEDRKYQYVTLIINDYILYVYTHIPPQTKHRGITYHINYFNFLHSFPNNFIDQPQIPFLCSPYFMNKFIRIRKYISNHKKLIPLQSLYYGFPRSKFTKDSRWINLPTAQMANPFARIKGFLTNIKDRDYILLTDFVLSDELSELVHWIQKSKQPFHKEWDWLYAFTHPALSFNYDAHPRLDV